MASKGFIGQMADMVYKSGANVLRQAENAFMTTVPSMVSAMAGPIAGAITSYATQPTSSYKGLI
jgi:hypothetical protein